MMGIVLFEDDHYGKFLPLVYTRPVGDMRIGILKIAEKWEQALHARASHELHADRKYLSRLFRAVSNEGVVLINARLLPDAAMVEAILGLKDDEALMYGEVILAARAFDSKESSGGDFFEKEYKESPFLLEKITDLYTRNADALKLDFAALTREQISQPVGVTNTVIGDPANVFVAEGAKVLAATLNTTEGPIYIDRYAEVMEGSHIRGPFYLGEHSQLKMASKIYGATTIGPHCKIGGEISNSLIFGYSNKAHDGFIGNTLLGEWCNLGADTNTSNLKNNYSNVRIWDYVNNQYADTGLTFCGLIMGDHTKCSINTMFNTGTIAGVCANVFGSGFPPKHIPSFGWGGGEGFSEYDLEKAFATADSVMARRNLPLTGETREMLTEIFRITSRHRRAATQSQE